MILLSVFTILGLSAGVRCTLAKVECGSALHSCKGLFLVRECGALLQRTVFSAGVRCSVALFGLSARGVCTRSVVCLGGAEIYDKL